MKRLVELLTDEMKEAFSICGYDEKYGIVSVSNRPDLCQFQCNGAMGAAKQYKKAPIKIAEEVIAKLEENKCFSKISAVMPGFINLNVDDGFLSQFLAKMSTADKFGCEEDKVKKTIVVDYGGANVAKPLHVGHLRPAVIGESVKRIYRYAGHKVIGDAHLGDWGLPMGLIIAWVSEEQPDLPYFDPDFKGEYPKEAPFTNAELEVIYPEASKRSKTDEVFLKKAQEAVYKLQNKDRGYYSLWQHIINTSIPDIKRVYTSLNVEFDLWKKESDAAPYIPEMIQYLKDEGYAHISEGALVVDVKEDTDTKEMPPCMILKSNGSTIYDTTDLATIVERVKLFNPDKIVYVVDKRQGLYFERIFRCVRKTKIVDEHMELLFLGNGTMNGPDGKPFKTRDGGVMRLDALISGINEEVYKKIMSNRETEESEARDIARKVGLAALKYGDLSNQATKDYIFDIDRFTSFEGNTGPYILYTIVRIKSILTKHFGFDVKNYACVPKTEYCVSDRECGDSEKTLMLSASNFADMIQKAAEETAPHKVCQYMYDTANAFNTFYHENKIITETDKKKQNEWISLIVLVFGLLEQCIELLGIEAPDKM